MNALKIPFDHVLPGQPSTNSLAERNNQSSRQLRHAFWKHGLPACFWKFAIRCVVEPGEDEVSSWCKLRCEEFKGEKIPFGALVYFKPSGARRNEQAHRFDPKAIPGDFASYEIAPGAIIDKLRFPHLTEKIEGRYPLTFPCKDICERVNTTLDGLAVKDRLEGSPDFLEDQQDEDDGEDDDEDDDGEDGDAPDGENKSKKKIKRINKAEHQEEEFDRIMRECEERLEKEAKDEVEIIDGPPLPPPDGKPPDEKPSDDKPPGDKPPEGEITLPCRQT
eukprot:s1011_g8.t1